jgi:very-short-patch-repair endonuclease
MRGYGFRRQSPILKYILNFMCVELNLVIEVDGGIHENEQIKERDEIRQKDIEEHGYTVLRFKNEEVLCNINWVIDEIEKWIQNYEVKNSIKHIPRPRWRHPQPPSEGGQDVE